MCEPLPVGTNRCSNVFAAPTATIFHVHYAKLSWPIQGSSVVRNLKGAVRNTHLTGKGGAWQADVFMESILFLGGGEVRGCKGVHMALLFLSLDCTCASKCTIS